MKFLYNIMHSLQTSQPLFTQCVDLLHSRGRVHELNGFELFEIQFAVYSPRGLLFL